MLHFVTVVLKGYFAIFSVAAHISLIVVIGLLFSSQVSEHWRWKAFKKMFASPVDTSDVVVISPVQSGLANPAFLQLPKNIWLKVHQQKKTDELVFQRQRHAGSAFDTKRLQLILFGSDTHGKDWNNSIQIFDMGALNWRRLYEPDERKTYSVNKNGVPVAGINADRPWAMGTFDSLVYDQRQDQLIVASYPKHLKPGRFGNWMSEEWKNIKVHPTWVYDRGEERWYPKAEKVVDFFSSSVSFNSDTQETIGFKSKGIFYFSDSGWKRIVKRGVKTYHLSSVYDTKNKAFILFGSSKHDNTVNVFFPDSKKLLQMPTSGIRPKGSEHLPFAFHQGIAKAVAIIDVIEADKSYAQTWAYDLKTDSWERFVSADFPFKLGMNYNMEYDPSNNLLVLVADHPDEPLGVWVLRLL